MTDLLPPIDPADLDRLAAGLALAADDAGLLDVAWTDVDTPVGPLLLAATPQGLVKTDDALSSETEIFCGSNGTKHCTYNDWYCMRRIWCIELQLCRKITIIFRHGLCGIWLYGLCDITSS